jgi:hypothetical protein
MFGGVEDVFGWLWKGGRGKMGGSCVSLTTPKSPKATKIIVSVDHVHAKEYVLDQFGKISRDCRRW